MVKKEPSPGARDRARALRGGLTEAERRLWQMLRSRQSQGHRFRRQVPIGRFIADFVCHEARLIVEIDGGQHDPSAEEEASRTRFLECEGYRVLRFWSNEVLDNPEGVCAAIVETLQRDHTHAYSTGHPHPTLPHRGGGREAAFKDPADWEVENQQLREELRQALAREAAIAEVLRVINSSPGDLALVFDALLEKATRLCGAPFGVLRTWDGERFHLAAANGDVKFTEWARNYGPWAPAHDSSPAGRIVRGEDIVRFADAPGDEAVSISPGFSELVEASGMRSGVVVALRKDDVLLGNMTVYRQEVRPFSDNEVALLQNFAAQAVIAMENARLLTETREALEQQTATAEVLQVINSSPGDLAPVFDAILEKAHSLCDASFGRLLIRDGDEFRLAAAHGEPRFVEAAQQLGPERPPERRVLARLERGEPIVVADVRAADSYHTAAPPLRSLIDTSGVRTSLSVPLRRDGAVLGIITASLREVRPFTDKQIALLQNFAAQAVIAMENARLLTETREALEQQTATAEVLQVINSSPGDLAPVFDAMLEKALSLCGAASGHLSTYDGERFRRVVVKGEPALVEHVERRGPFHPRADGAAGRIVGGEDLVYVEDILQTEDYCTNPRMREFADIGGIRTALSVALRKEGTLLGTIGVWWKEVRPLSDKQIALLQNFAAQAVIAMENARLITETREALEQQTATAEVLQVINSSPGDLAPVFDAILEKAHSLCGVQYGVLLTYDGELFWPVAMRGAPPTWEMRNGFRPSSGFAGLVRGERLLHIRDMAEFAEQRPDEPIYRELLENGGIRTQLAVPLRNDRKLLGIIAVNRREVGPFSEKQIALLENFAAQAVIAMENARLINETREALEQQTATAEVLQVINSSPGELSPVFDAILDKAHTFCGAEFGSLFLYDGEHFRAIASHGVPEALVSRLREGIGADDSRASRQLIAGEPFAHIHDSALEEHAVYRGMDMVSSHRTLLSVPLRKGDALLGMIAAGRLEVRPFTDKQIALLQNFAAQAVIAMENARLLTETREALEQQTATAEVLQVINSSPGDLTPVFDALLEKATRLCEATFGTLRTWDGERFHLGAVHGEPQFSDWVRQRGPIRPDGDHLLGRIVKGEGVIHFADSRDLAAAGFREMVTRSGMRSGIAVPLRKDGELLGTIAVYRQEVRPFTEKQIALLQNFAAQAVIAMENARLLGELRQRTDEVAELNRGLEARVAEQVDELGRVGRLKRFLAPQLADLIVARGDEGILESHRREIVVVFCDIRGFTAFAERAEPEEVMALLRDYHAALGPIVARYEGTLDHYGGDGIMVFFNDPLPCPEPAKRAIEMAVAMREAAAAVVRTWRRNGHDIGFGVGISQGYATLGQIGFAERMDYTAIGTVTNLAARLCGEAKDGQILIGRRVASAVEDTATLEEIGDLSLKGLSQAVAVYNVVAVAAPVSPS